jgi:hypothetical protein
MDPISAGIISAVVGGLILSSITAAGGFVFGSDRSKKKFRQKVKSAPSEYAERLGIMIQKAHAEGVSNSVVNARAIVAVRNEIRGSLISLSGALNSEISRLEGILSGTGFPSATEKSFQMLSERVTKEVSEPDPQELFHYIEVLHRTWPEKRVVIEREIKKLITELGLE